jgi:hypothetical protein
MNSENLDDESEKIGNSWVIFSLSLLIMLLTLWFTTRDSFWTGILAFLVSSILVILYCIYTSFKRKKQSL